MLLQTFIKPNFSFFSQINGNNDRKLMLLLTIIKPFQQLERTFKEIRNDKKSICSSLIGVRESIKSGEQLRNCVKQQLTFSFKVYRE
jgi:hypothetical protein